MLAMKKILILCFLFILNHGFCQGVWTQYNGPFAGNISSFATYKGALYVGARLSGVFKSEDHGKTWISVFPELPYVTCLYVHNDILYLANEQLFQYDGNDFSSISPVIKGAILSMTGINDKIFVATDFGVYAYNAANETLELKTQGMTPSEGGIFWTQRINQVNSILFCTSITNGLYRSRDLGENWEEVEVMWHQFGFQDMLVTGDSIFCAANSFIFRSINKGEDWDIVLPIESFNNIDVEIWKNNLVVIAATKGTWLLNSESSNWNKMSDREFSSIFNLNGVLFASDTDGIFRWDEVENNFVLSNEGINSASVNDIELFDNKLYAATEHGVHYTPTDGDSWVTVPELYGAYVNRFAKNDTILYAGTQYGLYSTLISSSKWIKNEVTATDDYPIWDIGVTSQNVFIAGNEGVFVLQGTNWKHLPNSISKVLQMTSLAANDTMLISGNSQGLFRISADSTDWEAFDLFKNKHIFSLEIIDGVIYVSFDNIVYRSSDYGRTWEHSSLPAGSYFDLIKRGDNIYGSTYNQIYYSADNGLTWTNYFETGLPNLLITCITEGDNAFYTGTFGKSIWKRPFFSNTEIESETYEITDTAIYNIESGTTLDEFKENVLLGYGTSLVVENSGDDNGRIVNSVILENSTIKVIAEDGINWKAFKVVNGSNVTNTEEEDYYGLNVYPNPAKDKLIIGDQAIVINDAVLNTTGVAYNVKRVDDFLEIEDLPSGMYFMRLKIRDVVHVVKFVKQ